MLARGGSFIYKYSPMPLSYAELERFYQRAVRPYMCLRFLDYCPTELFTR